MFRIVMIVALSLLVDSNILAQDNFVKDSTLDKHLRNYLISKSTTIVTDKNGQNIPLEKVYAYETLFITAHNLKTDSILKNKKEIGIYSFKFASLTEKPYLYFQYPNKIEFIELDKNFDLQKTVKRMMKFLKKYDNQFTLEEKLKTIGNAMEVVEYNKNPIKEY